MIINKLIGICPVCDEKIELDAEKVTIETEGEEALLSFKCPECNEYVDREALEKE